MTLIAPYPKIPENIAKINVIMIGCNIASILASCILILKIFEIKSLPLADSYFSVLEDFVI